MKRAYVDTSVLLSRYFDEADSEEAMRALRTAPEKISSSLVTVELASAFRRAERGKRINNSQLKTLEQVSKDDLKHFSIIGINEDLLQHAALLADQTGLRSLDAIHLASAKLSRSDTLLTFDAELRDTAKKMGFQCVW